MTEKKHSKRNRFVGLAVVAMVFGMIGLAYASVPLYRLFCQVTGYGGTPQVVGEELEHKVLKQKIKVRFNADVNRALDWQFKPVQNQVEIHIGEETLAFFHALNRSDENITGTATFNVTPLKAAPYFNKVQCFCFTEQKLAPGESADMPVSFYVDPAIMDDPNTQEIKTITLSYTFYRAPEES